MALQLLIGFSLMAQLVDAQFPQFPMLPLFQLPPPPTFPPFPQFTLPPLFNFFSGNSSESTHLSEFSRNLKNNTDLKAIKAMCLSRRDRRKILPKKLDGVSSSFIRAMIETIGLNELRSELKFKPLPPWKFHNESILAKYNADDTTEGFYYRVEPDSYRRSLNNKAFTEKQVYSSIGHLEKQVPLVRKVFKDAYGAFRRDRNKEEKKKEAEPKKEESVEDYESDEEEEERKKKEKKLKPKPKKEEMEKLDEDAILSYIDEFEEVSDALWESVEKMLDRSKKCLQEKRKKEEERKKNKKNSSGGKKKEEVPKKSSEEEKKKKDRT